MIDMSVGQENGVDVCWTKWKVTVVQLLQCLLSLKQPTIDKKSSILGSD